MAWQRLIQFEDGSAQRHYGDPIIKVADELYDRLADGSLEALEWDGPNAFSLRATGRRLRVRKLLRLLGPEDVPTIYCVGLNYKKHVQEAGRSLPPYPSIFMKPRTSIAGFEEDIPVPRIAAQCDYEGELSIVIGKTGRNIPESAALEYVAGYLASNDVSERKWQRDPAFAGSVPQWCFSKSFDRFAPTSAMLVSPAVLGDGSGLRLQTWVNGEARQDSNTSDLIFGVRRIVAFLSQGHTLEQGTIIMTGTPSGVGLGMSPPSYLRHNDIVKVELENIGRVENTMIFD